VPQSALRYVVLASVHSLYFPYFSLLCYLCLWISSATVKAGKEPQGKDGKNRKCETEEGWMRNPL